MSWFIVGAVVVSGLVAADAQKKAGQQQQYDIERQAETKCCLLIFNRLLLVEIQREALKRLRLKVQKMHLVPKGQSR